MTKSEIQTVLRSGLHSVTFLKLDGSERTMLCTLDPSLIPDSAKPKSTESELERKDNPELVKVYVPDLEGWRSFLIPNFIGFNVEGA